MNVKIRWSIFSEGEVRLTPDDVNGLSRAEIESMIIELIQLEIYEQQDYEIHIHAFDRAIKKLKE
jgi:hypothetical protein